MYGVVRAGNVLSHGTTAAGVRRFRCSVCGGTFTASTGTVTHLFRHERSVVVQGVALVLVCMQSIRDAGMDVGVAPSTLARWVKAAENSPDFMWEAGCADCYAVPDFRAALVRLGRDLGLITASEETAIYVGDRTLYRRLFLQLSERFGGLVGLRMALRL